MALTLTPNVVPLMPAIRKGVWTSKCRFGRRNTLKNIVPKVWRILVTGRSRLIAGMLKIVLAAIRIRLPSVKSSASLSGSETIQSGAIKTSPGAMFVQLASGSGEVRKRTVPETDATCHVPNGSPVAVSSADWAEGSADGSASVIATASAMLAPRASTGPPANLPSREP